MSFQILPKDPTLAGSLQQGMNQVMPTLMQQYQQQHTRGLLQESLAKARAVANDPKATPQDITFALMEAGAGIPGSERYISQLAPLLTKRAESNIINRSTLPGGGENVQPMEREPLPQFGQRPGQVPMQGVGLPSENVSPEGTPGNLPQTATAGVKKPLRTPNQIRQDAKSRVLEMNRQGIPLTYQEALAEENQAEGEVKTYNQEVEKEQKERIGTQRSYGERASNALKTYMPEATPEMQSIFKKKGENAFLNKDGSVRSEADFDKEMNVEARKFKNMLSNVRSDISAPRFQNDMFRKLMGTDKEFDAAAKDLQVKLKPLLDLELYDTARNELQSLGYYPEERERIINPLSDKVSTALNLVPQRPTEVMKNISGRNMKFPNEEFTERDKSNVTSAIMDSLSKDPSASLVLIRKAFEDKGYNWRHFKDSLNSLLMIPVEQGGINLNDDQFNQLKYLDEPPLNRLDKSLHSLNLIGR